VQATLKAIPTLLLQTYVTALSGSCLGAVAIGKASASVAFGLAAYEAGDFKGRQIMAPVPYASLSFMVLLLFRIAEVASQLLALQMAAAELSWEWAMLLLCNPVMVVFLWYTQKSRPVSGAPLAACYRVRLGFQHCSG